MIARAKKVKKLSRGRRRRSLGVWIGLGVLSLATGFLIGAILGLVLRFGWQ
jgi:uncharacterized membrane protein